MNNKIVLVGTGGHAKVVADIIRLEGKYEIVGCTTNEAELDVFEGIEVLGTDEKFSSFLNQGIHKVFVALGDNALRKSVTEKAEKAGLQAVTVMHPSVQIGNGVKVGAGTCLMAGAIINPHAVIGRGVIVNTNVSIDHDCTVGDWAHVAPGSNLAGSVDIGEGTFLGVGTMIIPGIAVGKWAVLGAGSVVVKDIPNNMKAYGVPARCIEVVN